MDARRADAISASGGPGPITVEIVRGLLTSAQLEMCTLIERTAMSPIIREKQDYFCGLFDRDCQLLIGTKMPSGGTIVPPVLAHFPASGMRPGDIYLYNDCYGSDGAVSHSPDMVFVAPVFQGGELVGYSFAWAHFLDIGGAHPGSITPDATNLFQEGIIVPPVRFAREGRINDDLFRMFVRNSRFPDVVRGDTRSLTAAVRLGERRLAEIFERFGHSQADGAFAALIEQTTSVVRARLKETFPPGAYHFADCVDEDGFGAEHITIRAVLEVEPDRFVLDVTDSDDQTTGPINFLMSKLVPGMVLGLYMTADSPQLLPNEGLVRALDELKLREGSVLRPRFPAPLGQRSTTSRRVHTTCLGLVAVAAPEKAHASSSAYVLAYISGHRAGSGKPYLKTVGLGVGQGARAYADGIDAVYYIAQQNYPVEFTEQNYPLRVRRYAIHRDSGGPGRWRGGCGVVRDFELLGETASVMLRMSNVRYPPFGVSGGMAGRPGRFVMNPGTPHERVLPSFAQGVRMERGDILRAETPGGGGFGHPFDREPEFVLRDVLADIVSLDGALNDYGVVIDPQTLAIDPEATGRRRREARWPTGLIHRERYFDETGWYESFAPRHNAR